MKSRLCAFVLVLLTAGCVAQLAPAPPTPTPIPATLMPTPIPATVAAIPTAASTPTRVAPSPTAAPGAPFILQRLALRELPGAGHAPYDVAILGDKVYTLNSSTSNLAVIQNDRIVKYIPLEKSADALAADPIRKRLYLARTESKTISVVENDRVTWMPSIGDSPRSLLVFEEYLLVGLDNRNGILVLDTATLQIRARIPIPDSFSVISLAGDPQHHRVYAGLYDRTAVIDTKTWSVLAILPTKGSYQTLAAYPPNGSVLTAMYDSPSQSQYLTAFDPLTGKQGARVKIGSDSYAAVLSPDNSRIYVANSFTNDVSVIDPRSMTVVATIPVSMRPRGLALDENAHRLYVANSESDSVSVINTDNYQVVATIPLSMMLTALAANENTGRVYVANASTDSVYVIEGARVAKEIGVGHHPVDLARDAPSNRLLVANQADGTLSIIDETNLSIRATQPITRYLTTVAVDAAHARVFARGVILDLKTLTPTGQRLTMVGNTIGSIIAPEFVRVNPNNNRIYALGWNGTPGSNGRTVTYSIDGDTLQQRTMLSYYGSSYFFAIDPNTNRIFVAGFHPMAYTSELNVFDANDAKLFALALPARPTGMVYNPQTQHLFLSHTATYVPYGPQPTADNTVLILDANSFGEVALLSVDAPGKMTRLGNTIYVAGFDSGSLTLIQDANVPTPPSPTPTLTRTPWPTPTPGPSPTFAPTWTRLPTVAPAATPLSACAISVATFAASRWTPQLTARLGCPIEKERTVNFAAQPFDSGGIMFWREDDKRIYVLLNDQTWAAYDDTWTSALPEDTCPDVRVPAGLVKPKRGFGKVWCEQSNMRAKIGAGTVAEYGYAALTQRFERGLLFAGAQPSRIFVLFADGKWE